MHRPVVLTLAALVALVGAAVTAAGSGSVTTSTGWDRISGPTQPGAQLGLARTAGGVLHVIWNRGATPTSIFETRLSAAGKKLGTSTVATGWDGNAGLALLVMPDRTLRLFAAGATRPGSSAYGINTFTAPASGGSWSLQSGTFWGGAFANSSAVIGAALTKDGQPVTAWRGFAAEGVPPSSTPQNAYVTDQTASHLATDGRSGAVVLAGVTIAGKGGVFVQQILPGPGKRVVLPLPYGTNDWYSAVSGRIGAPGIYVAYADTRAVRLARYGGRTATVARGPYTSAGVCAGPDGRLWVAWGNSNDGLFVTRSNRAAGSFEPVQKLKLPPSSTGLTFVQCEGSTGPLDLFADAGGFWHAHLLAQFAVHAAVAHMKAGAKVTVSVRDAGDPVAGAAVVVGGRHLRTGANGSVSLTLRRGGYSASASAPGYTRASTSFHV
jgi:hypothetical protein